jgi:hypothetical protein
MDRARSAQAPSRLARDDFEFFDGSEESIAERRMLRQEGIDRGGHRDQHDLEHILAELDEIHAADDQDQPSHAACAREEPSSPEHVAKAPSVAADSLNGADESEVPETPGSDPVATTTPPEPSLLSPAPSFRETMLAMLDLVKGGPHVKRELNAYRQQLYRERQLESDPDGFAEREREKGRKHRAKRRAQDPELFKAQAAERQRRSRANRKARAAEASQTEALDSLQDLGSS